MTTVRTSPVRTGQALSNGNGRGRKSLRAPKGPRGEHARRRAFGPDYKLAILAEYDRCTEPGEKGALQHREGSLVVTPGRAEGGRGGPSRTEVARLRAENERLRKKLAKAEAIIEVQGKVHALLEELSKSADSEESSTPSSTTE